MLIIFSKCLELSGFYFSVPGVFWFLKPLICFLQSMSVPFIFIQPSRTLRQDRRDPLLTTPLFVVPSQLPQMAEGSG